jgi:integrase
MATIVQRGPLQWQAKIRRKGFPMLTKTFDLKADAERWARKIEREMDAGEWRDTRLADGMTVSELIDRYRVEVTPTKKGADREIFRLRVLLRSKLASLSVSRVRSSDVAEFRNQRTKDGASANTVRNDLNTLSAVFEWARSELSFAVENPVRAVKKPSPGRGRERRLQSGEEQALLDACSPTMRALVVVALETGMRLGELCLIERQHVDLRRRVARLLDTKNGSARGVPLSSAAVAAIQALPSALRGPVFGIASRSATVMFSRTCKRAGIEGLRFHDLRHEALSRLAERGDFNVLELAAISGHKSLSMLKRYTHIEAEKLAKKLG